MKLPWREAFEVKALACTKCELCPKRGSRLIGDLVEPPAGLEAPRVLVVATKPSPEEAEGTAPFLGPVDGLLRRDYLAAAGVKHAYLVSLVMGAPINRPPSSSEVAACEALFEEQAKLFDPHAIILLGRLPEDRVTHWTWAAQLPRVSVVAPQQIVQRGLNRPGAAKEIATQTAKIRMMMNRLGAGVRKTATAVCDHQPVSAGIWVQADGTRTPFKACRLCSRLESA